MKHHRPRALVRERRAGRLARLASFAGEAFLFAIAVGSATVILFIFHSIIRDALPFFRSRGLGEFFGGTRWYPSREPAEFGALTLFYGSAMVTFGAMVVAGPMGIAAAVCLSDVLPFGLRQAVKPVIEVLAAIPSVAYGFFALVVFAPLLQEHGGRVLALGTLVVGVPLAVLAAVVFGDLASGCLRGGARRAVAVPAGVLFGAACLGAVGAAARALHGMAIASGTTALNVSIILGIMALPTVVSVCEDALSTVGRELREASYGLGATRMETVVKVVVPAARSGILAAVLLGAMRAVGETMVVWMASGNAAQIPSPWWNVLAPVRTVTATIAGDMGEADHVTGSDRYHVLFALALCLLTISFVCNLVSEWAIRRSRRTGE
ncbi:MAG: phosphate ABC transporter permease subunit PstC [Candidatus Brocadiaceae bacterium]|nr:phosphate ABC transporter permease subunit PstC [Candidatus Brocadiaceae bacterium]